jgi:hypothetical protein
MEEPSCLPLCLLGHSGLGARGSPPSSLRSSVAGPRTVKIVSNLVCGRLMLVRMALTFTVLGDLSRWQSNLRFPPL